LSCTSYRARILYLGVLASPSSRWLSAQRSLSSRQCWWPFFMFLDLVFSKLDLRSSKGLWLPRVTSSPSPASQLFDSTSRTSFPLPCACAWCSCPGWRFPTVDAWIARPGYLVVLRSTNHWSC